MGRIVSTTFVTLDGVMQGPGHPDEDRSGGFDRGGWAPPYADADFAELMGEGIAQSDGLLFGRRTYEHFAAVWPQAPADDQFGRVLNERQKFVASATLAEPLPWAHSALLSGRAEDTVPVLKEQREKDTAILGSATLVRALLRAGLLDELVLVIHPLVLGTGRRLFEDDGLGASLRLERARTTGSGLVIASYTPAAQQ